jgi:hypothetical protein
MDIFFKICSKNENSFLLFIYFYGIIQLLVKTKNIYYKKEEFCDEKFRKFIS